MHVCVLVLAGMTRGKMYWVSPGSTRQLFAIRRLYTYPAVSLDTQLSPKSPQMRMCDCPLRCTGCSCDLLSIDTLIGSSWSSNTRQATLMRFNFHWAVLSGSSHQPWPHLHQTTQFELTDIIIDTLYSVKKAPKKETLNICAFPERNTGVYN